jgi:hypothetical protein
MFKGCIYQIETPGYFVGFAGSNSIIWKLVPPIDGSPYTGWWYCVRKGELPDVVVDVCCIWSKGSYDIPIYEFLNGVFGE